MAFVYVFFVWCIAMIIYNVWTGKKEKEKMTISKKAIQKYNEKYTK